MRRYFRRMTPPATGPQLITAKVLSIVVLILLAYWLALPAFLRLTAFVAPILLVASIVLAQVSGGPLHPNAYSHRAIAEKP